MFRTTFSTVASVQVCFLLQPRMPGRVHSAEVICTASSSYKLPNLALSPIKLAERGQSGSDGSHRLAHHCDDCLPILGVHLLLTIGIHCHCLVGIRVLLMPGNQFISQNCSQQGLDFEGRVDKTSGRETNLYKLFKQQFVFLPGSCNHACSERSCHSNTGDQFCQVGGQPEGDWSIGVKFSRNIINIKFEVCNID